MEPDPLRVEIQHDDMSMQLIVRLTDGTRYIQVPIPYETIVRHDSKSAIARALEHAANLWVRRFDGRSIKIHTPKSEGEVFSASYDNTIDGEVVRREIEGAPGS